MERRLDLRSNVSTYFFILFFFLYHCVVLQVMFPSGAKVTIERYSWGMDVYLFTPRAKDSANEKGLCLDPGNQNRDSYGDSLRYCQLYIILYYITAPLNHMCSLNFNLTNCAFTAVNHKYGDNRLTAEIQKLTKKREFHQSQCTNMTFLPR